MWVDEKSQQVSLMGVIYWKATRVLVWLGEEDKSAKQVSAAKAFEFIRRCSDFKEAAANNRRGHPTAMPEKIEDIQGSKEAVSWESVRRLFTRDWFTRVWVVQELGLARNATFYCGDASIDFWDLDRFCEFLLFHAPLNQTHYRLNLQTLNLALKYQESTRGNHRLEFGSDPHLAEDLCDVLASARGLECTDPRDSVYAFLGHPSAFKQQLLDPEPYMWYPRNFYNNRPTVIQPDYNKDTTAMNVYFRFAFTMIEQHGLGMKLLRYIQHNEISIEGDTLSIEEDAASIEEDIPSWVPRWNICEASPFTRAVNFYTAATRLPSTSFEVSLGTAVDPITLNIKAHCMGPVYCSMLIPYEQYTKHSPDIETETAQPPAAKEDYYNPLESIIETLDVLKNDFATQEYCDLRSLSATLTGGLTCNEEGLREVINEKNATQHYYDFCAYRHAKSEDTRNPGTTEAESSTLSLSQDYKKGDNKRYTAAYLAESTRCFLTRDGRLGLGPRITAGGDQIWLPMGADTPFVLRPLHDGNFKILGQAYLHGVMHGEAVAHLTEGDFEVVKLV
ncbi:hypothetical protein GGP41_003071 [Bipolaris sorokiniana]|uniref:Heterokaryon incompatibility domain-containing protein n=2 Tax=Cochliobolus sativus TaxID=45130 RepID=A0A8H5ZCF8_COCSA|nr:hypothetical protein GGP41_003071 [Bipolaris sorokiniana]